ncbi:MAG: FlgO family outer membrane protein [Nitrospirota bacterium]
MKKHLIILIIAMLSLFTAQESWCDFQKIKIAVLDFQIQGKGFETEDMGKIVAEWLITALVQEGRFDVIERRLIEKVLEEQSFTASGAVDARSASRLGKVLGAKIVISGSVIRLSRFTEVNARLIRVESGSILAAEKVKSASTIKLEELVTRMAKKIINDFPLEGYIVQRDEDKVILDLGKIAGVKKGMRFVVFKEGKAIRHPKTGEVLDIAMIKTGEVEILRMKEKTSVARVIKDAKDQKIEYGQLVKSINTAREIGAYRSVPSPERKYNSLSDTAEPKKIKEIEAANAKIEKARQMKASGDPGWSTKIMDAYGDLKKIYRRYARKPEIWLSFARCYWVNNSVKKAEKSLQKAFYYNSNYTEAHIFRGEMYFEEGKKVKHNTRALNKYRQYSKGSFEAALFASGLDSDTKAEIYFRLGDMYHELYSDSTQAKSQWKKAASTAPGSRWAQKAQEKLSAL